ncbi:MAG: hypothetical protein C0507_15895 [Cyanobacteria bacterium PR.3.49]|nr:hypothetical protein [Cyanobacteria bacterium PR.3.49]
MPERTQVRERTQASDNTQPANPRNPDVPEAAQKLAEEFGLLVTKSKGSGALVFSKPAQDCASRPEIISQGSNLNALRQDLTQKRDAVIERLEDEHLVDILVEGEKIGVRDGDGKPLTAPVQTPNFSQLAAIEHSLQRSLPADAEKRTGIVGWFAELFDNDRVKIGLAKEDTDPASLARYYNGNVLKGVLPRIVIDPDSHNSASVYMHELAHHGQAGFWKSEDRDGSRWQEYLKMLGWVRAGDLDLRLTNDSPPQMFHCTKDEKRGYVWSRMDDKGNFLDAAGKRVESQDKAQQITNGEMNRRALVGPADQRAYMKNPLEHGAELVMNLRNNQNSRAALLQYNSHAYGIAVELDQKEIDGFYGVDWFGKSRRIRMPNGEIVENNEKARMELEVWESINSRAPERTNYGTRFSPPNPVHGSEKPTNNGKVQQFEHGQNLGQVQARQQQAQRQH